MDLREFEDAFSRLTTAVGQVLQGKPDVVALTIACACARGHVLIEDVPGTGKSVLARAFAAALGAPTRRVQCTPDLLPGDLTGSLVADLRKGELVFRPGPVFAQVVLVDEINRATPKTQSALLEAMAERQVTVDGVTYDLPDPHLVIATQNQIEQAGTFLLPEAQLDRFMVRLAVGYADEQTELDIVRAHARGDLIDDVEAVSDVAVLREMIELSGRVVIPEPVEQYLVAACRATRADPAVAIGASTRATIALARLARVTAAADGRAGVVPDDVHRLLTPVLAHRLVLTPEAELRGETVAEVLTRTAGAVRPPLGISPPTRLPSPARRPAPARRARRRPSEAS